MQYKDVLCFGTDGKAVSSGTGDMFEKKLEKQLVLVSD